MSRGSDTSQRRAATRMRPLRPFAARLLNPAARLVAGRLPWFANLIHVGRRTGRLYRTPLNVFRRGEHFYVALTYGSDVDWLKNVLAAGGCEIETRGRRVRLVDPQLIVDRELGYLPLPARVIERLNGVTESLRMRLAHPDRTTPPAR